MTRHVEPTTMQERGWPEGELDALLHRPLEIGGGPREPKYPEQDMADTFKPGGPNRPALPAFADALKTLLVRSLAEASNTPSDASRFERAGRIAFLTDDLKLEGFGPILLDAVDAMSHGVPPTDFDRFHVIRALGRTGTASSIEDVWLGLFTDSHKGVRTIAAQVLARTAVPANASRRFDVTMGADVNASLVEHEWRMAIGRNHRLSAALSEDRLRRLEESSA